jgi:hypothetical protein
MPVNRPILGGLKLFAGLTINTAIEVAKPERD